MQNLFRRNRTFYIRLSISKELQPYFNNNSSYIRSLQTKNNKNATIIAKYLIAKFNYIKRSFMMLSAKEISIYIDEFKKVSYDDIINRNDYLSVEEIDDSIEELNSDVKIDNPLIKQELHDLMQMLDTKYSLDSLYGFDTDDAETFKKYIVKIKINALSDVKKSIKIKTSADVNNTTASTINTGTVLIKEAIEDYLNSKSGVSKAVVDQDILNLNRFTKWCDIVGITYIETLKHKNLIEFRSYRQKISPKSKPGTINRTLANISTFIKYCIREEYLLRDISKGIKLKLTIKEKQDTKRDPYKDKDIQKVFDNIELIKRSPKRKELRKYHAEYPMIIKLAMYSGARENEICQLTKKDIKQEDNIYYIDLNLDDSKSIKNIPSIRKVPIHPDILQDLLKYIKSIKRKNLFTISGAQFAIDYSNFKTMLGFGRKIVFHSFRNTLQNKLKQKRVQNMIINELTGHGREDEEKMTDGYTPEYDLDILYDELLKVKYNVVLPK